jgi:hypothetical protein
MIEEPILCFAGLSENYFREPFFVSVPKKKYVGIVSENTYKYVF